MPAVCPICSKAVSVEHRPFCSRRCADIDLQRWLSGRYAIPAADPDDEDDTPGPGPDLES